MLKRQGLSPLNLALALLLSMILSGLLFALSQQGQPEDRQPVDDGKRHLRGLPESAPQVDFITTRETDDGASLVRIHWGEVAAMLAVIGGLHTVVTRYYIRPMISQETANILANAKKAAQDVLNEHIIQEELKQAQVEEDIENFRVWAKEMNRTLNWHSDILIQLATKESIPIPPRPQ